jgi:hypothetical protein
MSKPVLFYGKPGQLDSLFTYVEVQFRLTPGIDDGTRAATLASLFRGGALDWLTQTLRANPAILDSYEGFKETVTEEFSLDDHAQKSQAARALTQLRQTKDVHSYGQRFRTLSHQADVAGPTATALFIKGLKPRIRDAVIISDERDSLDDAITEATRIDSQLYYAGSRQSGSNAGRQRGSGRDTKGRFTKDATRIKSEF